MKAVILCGGLGTRLGSLTKDTPKPLLEVAGQPFIGHVLNSLTRAGVDGLVLAVGFQWQKLFAYVGDRWNGIPVQYSVESHPLGTGGAIKAAMASASLTEALVVNGDTLFDIDIPHFFKFANNNDSAASIALRKVDDCSRYGRVTVNAQGRILTFGEKQHSGVGLINGGVYFLRSGALDYIALTSFSLETNFFLARHLYEPFYGLPFNDYFIDIGVPADLHRAQAEIMTWKKG